MRLMPVIAQGRFDDIAPRGVDIGVGDDGHLALAQAATAMRHEFGQQARANADFVRATSDIYRNHSHCEIP
ncbi:hypothetical protein GCM10011494_20880 [Novosphingobium endophyticum]|uniref:Uncharacterized protein n=1 Tax=Novosphingobium endophyticum TaxID=1955250 RepID=A0A916TSE0_9SPHN|nr:hypothetical protein GCM10011494_20880 [Novosphingobium endophyticum]